MVADESLVERVLDDTYPVWHEGLTRDAYSKWSRGQLRTPWGREHLQRFVMLDDGGGHVASLKRYRYPVRARRPRGLDVRDRRRAHGAGLRGHGHASRLVEQVVERSRAEGALVAGLFSEIGTAFYERLGFSPVLLDEVSVHVTRRDGSPAMLVRAGDDRDLPALAAMHAVRAASARFALRRDPALIQYALAKKRLFAGLSARGARQLEFFVAEEGASAVAYVVFSQNEYRVDARRGRRSRSGRRPAGRDAPGAAGARAVAPRAGHPRLVAARVSRAAAAHVVEPERPEGCLHGAAARRRREPFPLGPRECFTGGRITFDAGRLKAQGSRLDEPGSAGLVGQGLVTSVLSRPEP